jgi:hypothetical protein
MKYVIFKTNSKGNEVYLSAVGHFEVDKVRDALQFDSARTAYDYAGTRDRLLGWRVGRAMDPQGEQRRRSYSPANHFAGSALAALAGHAGLDGTATEDFV